jgi:hypothetical protein
MSKLCIVVGRLLGEFVVGWLAVGSSPLTGTIAGYTQTASVPIRALSGEYVLICCGTPQSSLLLAMSELCIVIGRLLGDVVGWLAVGSSPLTGTIVGCTGTVSLPIHALSGEYVLLHGTPQLSLSLGMCKLCIVIGRLLGDFVVGWLAVGSSPLTGTIAGCTGTVSLPIHALSGEYVLIHGTPQSSLSLAMSKLCIVVGRLHGEFVVGWLAVDSPLPGLLTRC